MVLCTWTQHLHRLGSTCAGTQIGVLALCGMPISLATHEDLLAIVWHGGGSGLGGHQALQYSIVEVEGGLQVHRGELPLSVKATLQWLGFTEEGLLAACDSKVWLLSTRWDAGHLQNYDMAAQ